MTKKIFITGVAGFLGSHIADAMLEKGYDVVGNDNLVGGYLDNVPDGVEFHNVDCCDLKSMQKITKDVDILYHCAAHPYEGLSVFSPSIVTKSIFQATSTVLSAFIQNNGDRFVNMSCYDEKTRLVTTNGIKNYQEIDKNDKVITINPKNGGIEIKKINDILVYDYEGEMLGIDGKRVDLLVTPNHRMILQHKKSRKIYFREMRDIYEKSILYLPQARWKTNNNVSSIWKFNNKPRHWNAIKYPDTFDTKDLFYIIGLYIGDGSGNIYYRMDKKKSNLTAREYVSRSRDKYGRFTKIKNANDRYVKNSVYRIRFSLPKGDNAREKIKKVLDRNNCHYTVDDDVVQIIGFQELYELLKQCGDNVYEKHIPKWMLDYPIEYLEKLFEGLIDSDGYWGSNEYTTTSKKLLVDMIELGVKLGKGVSYSLHPPKKVTFPDGHICNSRESYYITFPKTQKGIYKRNYIKKQYKGKVWCLNVDNHNFLVERNGKINFSGNSMARFGMNQTPFTEDMLPRPQDPYAVAKVASEDLIKLMSRVHDFEYVIAVPHNIYGIRQKYDDPFRNVVAIFINRMLQGKQPIIYGDGTQKRCFSYIKDDIIPLSKLATYNNVVGETINIGPDEEFVSINQLASEIADILDFDLKPIYLPDRPQEVKNANCSANKARRLLDYKTKYSLRDGLEEMINWINERGVKPFDYYLDVEIVNDKTPKTWKEKLI